MVHFNIYFCKILTIALFHRDYSQFNINYNNVSHTMQNINKPFQNCYNDCTNWSFELNNKILFSLQIIFKNNLSIKLLNHFSLRKLGTQWIIIFQRTIQPSQTEKNKPKFNFRFSSEQFVHFLFKFQKQHKTFLTQFSWHIQSNTVQINPNLSLKTQQWNPKVGYNCNFYYDNSSFKI